MRNHARNRLDSDKRRISRVLRLSPTRGESPTSCYAIFNTGYTADRIALIFCMVSTTRSFILTVGRFRSVR